MISLDILKKRGVTQEKLKSLFTAPEKHEKIDALVKRIASRIRDGVSGNIRDSKIHYAVDLAWNAPIRQTTYTLLQSVQNKSPDEESVNRALADWGLSNMISEEVDAKGGKRKALNVPTFFNIFVPLVKAYVTMRWGAICNKRNQVPFFKYEPKKNTMRDRVKAEIITDRVQDIAAQYDYVATFRQCVLHTLLYQKCLQFPVEAWRDEKQLQVVDGMEKEVYVREGIRYHIPHPSRVFHDLAYRTSTFNSDSGCNFAGYWSINRYGEIKANRDWWNLDRISVGTTDWIQGNASTYFNTVYPCVINFPRGSGACGNNNAVALNLLDRESNIEFYTSEYDDKSVLTVNYFEKLIPKDYGLGDYEHPVWFRFVMANTESVLYCEPLPYCPVVAYLYDSHETQALNSSMALEILPFQDHIGNMLTQYLLSVKQNLASFTFYDSDQVDEAHVEKLRNLGEKMYRSRHFVPYSGRKSKMISQQQPREAFTSHTFPQLDTSSVAAAVQTIISTLERTLMLSAQEIGQAAPHEQTAEEVRNIAEYTSTRLTFTSAPIDQAIYAWKCQVYKGLMAYGEPSFYAQIETPVGQEALAAMGFTVEEPFNKETKRTIVRVPDKTAISMESFASVRDGDDRIDNAAMAKSMADLIIGILNNPMIAPAIGPEQALEWMNHIARLAGFPRDIQLRSVQPTPEEAKEELMALAQQVRESVIGEVREAIMPMAESVKSHDEVIQRIINVLEQIQQAPPPAPYDSMPVDPAYAQAVGAAPPMVAP